MRSGNAISRRAVLRGTGAALALPWLEAMTPSARAADAAKAAPPNRIAFLYVPNGMHMPDWTPSAEGTDFQLPFILEPLQPHQKDLLVLSGLTCDKARAKVLGNHARALAAFLTGCAPFKTDGAGVRVGVSADQIAAKAVGRNTRFPSLELGCDPPLFMGSCDAGYSCAYTSHISWRTETSPTGKDVSPRNVFDRLFSSVVRNRVDRSRTKEERYRTSVLDLVRDDAVRLRPQLGKTDQRKLDEYLHAVREIEVRIARSAEDKKLPTAPRPPLLPANYQEHIRLMCDLIALAFQADLTRIATFVLANEFSQRPYPWLGVRDGHHYLSHHGNDPKKHAKIREINRFHIAQFAYLLDKLKSVKEGDGTLLDRCLIAYGSGNSDGNVHDHGNLPVLLAGRGGGTVKAGRHIRYPAETPVTNLWLSMLDRMGVTPEAIGDSTGRLSGLE